MAKNHERSRIECEDPGPRTRSCSARDSAAPYHLRRDVCRLLTPLRRAALLVVGASIAALAATHVAAAKAKPGWLAGIGTRVITPERGQWLSGYGSNRPAAGKRHDLWVKA